MQILKGIGIDWLETILISKLYMHQNVKITGPRGDKQCEDWKRS
jgi:hypothetical protein